MANKATPRKVKLHKPDIKPSSQVASRKPVISLGTLATVVIFAAVVLLMVYLNRQKETAPADAELTPTIEASYPIFDPADGMPTSIQITPAEGEEIKLTLNKDNIWVFDLPQKAEADQGLVQSASSQVNALMALRTIEGKPEVFGLTKPAYIITLAFGEKTRVLEVGDATPTNSGYYTRVDGKKIVICDLSGIDALTQMVLFPPYAPTPTPEATLEPTATAAPETSVTPTP